MATIRLARHAMATRFEILLCGENPVSLRAAGEEALDEIDRLEAQLSLFRPTSEIAHVNARAAHKPVRVTPAVFGLLEHARQLTQQTAGAFDVTIAPLMRCWGFQGGTGRVPDAAELAAARECTGMRLVHLNAETCSVQFERPGVMIDLGAIGKGYAIDRAVELLREAGVESGLIHGGTSTAFALGRPAEGDFWKIEIPCPKTMESLAGAKYAAETDPRTLATEMPPASPTTAQKPFAVVALRDTSLSVSAVWGKFFHSEGRCFGHIIDPRSGQPANRAVLSAVALESATETDAFSTALLTAGLEGYDRIASLRTGMRSLVAAEKGRQFEFRSKGIQVSAD